MAKFFIDAGVSTEKDAMAKQDGSALALTGSARVLYDDTLQKRQLSVLINRLADKIQETYEQGAPVASPIVQIANRTAMPVDTNTNTSAYRFFNSRNMVRNRTGVAVNDVILGMGNFFANGATTEAGTTPVKYRIALQIVGVQRVEVLWGGVNEITVAPGVAVFSDPMHFDLDIPDNTAINVIVYAEYDTAPARLHTSLSPTADDANEGSTTAITDKHMSGTISGRVVARTLFTPLGLYARAPGRTKPSILDIGDSVAAGANDSTAGTNGFIQRALNMYPITHVAMSGYSYSAAWASSASTDLLRKLSPVRDSESYDYATVCLGGNDVLSGGVAATIASRMSGMGTYLATRGMKMIPMTGMPRTNNTNDGPYGSDAAGAMTQYINLRQLIIDGNGVGNGYFDRMAAVQQAGDMTRWDNTLHPPGTTATDRDGVHPITAGHTLLTTALGDAAPTLFPSV